MDPAVVFGLRDLFLLIFGFARRLGWHTRACIRRVCVLLWQTDPHFKGLHKVRVVGIDTGPVNMAAAMIEHRPAETRRQKIAAAVQAILEPELAPERTRLVSARLFNLKGNHLTARYDRGKPWAISIKRDYDSDVDALELTLRLPDLIRRWDALFERDPNTGLLPIVVVECPGGGNPYDAKSAQDNNVKNWFLTHATASAIRSIDGERGFAKEDRLIEYKAKKKDVERGTLNTRDKEHKEKSIMVGAAALAKDEPATDFVAALRKAGQKLDDFFDGVNMGRAKDDEMRPWPHLPSAKTVRPPKRRKLSPGTAATVIVDLVEDSSDEDTVDLPHKPNASQKAAPQ